MRILTVYDLLTQPISVGDVISTYYAAQLQMKKIGADIIDFCVVYNREMPSPIFPFKNYVNSSNVQFHMKDMLDTISCLKHVGNVYVFDSHQKLNESLPGIAKECYFYPPIQDLNCRKYLYYNHLQEVYIHYLEHKSIPPVEIGQGYRDWAAAFHRQHCLGKVPVTVQLRCNPHNPERDSNFPAWRAFFEKASADFPATFIVIGAMAEMQSTFQGLGNVVLAKSYGTSAGHDLALVEASAAHLGASSGPAMIPIFSEKPFRVFGCDIYRYPENYPKGFLLADREKFVFNTPHQQLLAKKEEAEDIEREFLTMWPVISNSVVQ